ncbi:hypothetical protein BDA99DRAFT_525693 [Phascolomyces articulosus]|uniref:Uncharacterized protein n=1 Tax=Phascolomyces articulosus TaxID=60185 RepID=A0AAD5P8A3_9FUNG|nr:hypothetical protein BDA99DRAFT_525693 [Phascolomyces articulosus]
MTQSNKKFYFQSSFDENIQLKLHLKEFWITEDPCYWTLHYLQKLVSQDPGISRRDASIRLVNDSKIVQQHVVAGTVAETTTNSMNQYNRTIRGKNAFKNFFEKGSAAVIAESSVNFSVQKHRLRSSMAEQIANEEEEKITRKRCGVGEGSSSDAVQKQIKENEEESEDDSDTNEVDVWEQWKKFLDNPQNTNHLMQLSPEKHKII